MKFNNVIKSIVKHELKMSANSTTCGIFYQPVTPKGLKKYSKIRNDK